MIMNLSKKNKYIVRKILIVLILFWIALSVLRLSFNLSKLITEEQEWLFLSDDEKKSKIFNNYYNLNKFLLINTRSKSKILLVTKDGMLYYYSRYDLYPREVYWQKDITSISELGGKYDYIFLDQRDFKSLSNSDLEKVNSFITTDIKGVLYKR